MRAVPAGYAELMASAVLRPCWEVTAWLGATYLGPVEVRSGTVTESAADQVAGSLDLTVPNTAASRPKSTTSPLGWYGQQLRVRTGWKDAAGKPRVWFDLGRYRIRKPVPAGEVLQVKGDSLHQLVVNARFFTPYGFPAGTYKSRVRTLLKSVLPVTFDPQLVDRPIKAQTYERERIEALNDTLSSWPAQLEILPSGVAYVGRAWENRGATVLATYSDGPGGLVVDVAPEGGEDDVPNAVVASSEPDDGKPPLTEVAYTSSGALRWGGPYGFLPAFYSSPLLTTRAQVRAAAQTRLASLQRAVQQVRVTMVVDPRLQLGDVIRVKSAKRGTDVTGRVTGIVHGLTPVERQGDVTVSVLSGVVDGVKV